MKWFSLPGRVCKVTKKFLQMGYKNKFWSLGPEGLPFHLWSEYGIKSAIEDYKTAGKTKGILLPGTGCKVAKNFLHMGYENKFWSLGLE